MAAWCKAFKKRVGCDVCPPPHPTQYVSVGFWLLVMCAYWQGKAWCRVGCGRIELRYVRGTLAFGVVALVSLSRGPWGRWAWVVVSLYFVAELVLFIWRWLFVDRGAVLDPVRSLRGFLLNVVGVVIFFGVAFLGLGCVEDDPVRWPGWTAAYASFRTFTTLGTDKLRDCMSCQALVVWEGLMAYVLTAVIIGGVAGLVVASRQ